MLTFASSMTRVVNAKRAMLECLDVAVGEAQAAEVDVIVFHAAMGHDHAELVGEARRLAPQARILGASCCGVVGKEGVSESMKDLALMTISGGERELGVATVDEIYGHNSFEYAAQMAREVKAQAPGVNMVYLMASGIDIATDQLIAGVESVLGEEVTIFGATSSDNMKGIISYQTVDGAVMEHGAWLLGFADPSLEVITQATHGFVAVGDPLKVSRSDGNRIIELNGRPAWQEYTDRLGLSADATTGESIPVGALGEALPDEVAAEYGNPHILRVVTQKDDDAMVYACTCPEGTELWLTKRDEERIFGDLDTMMKRIVRQLDGRQPIAVFHADCLARGRYTLNRVLKDEIVGQMQAPLFRAGQVPWLGMYGFGEFARLSGKNTFHNYTTALYVLTHKA